MINVSHLTLCYAHSKQLTDASHCCNCRHCYHCNYFIIMNPVECLATSATALNGSWLKWTTSPFSTDVVLRRTTDPGSCTARQEKRAEVECWERGMGCVGGKLVIRVQELGFSKLKCSSSAFLCALCSTAVNKLNILLLVVK